MSEPAAIYHRAARYRRSRNRLEYFECVLFADFLERKARVLFTHVPNGEDRGHVERIDPCSGRLIRYSPAGRKLQRMGVRRGVSDYIIFDRPPLDERFKGAVIEIKAKREDGGRPPSPEEEDFLAEAAERGYAAAWFYGADLAIAWCQQLGWGRDRVFG